MKISEKVYSWLRDIVNQKLIMEEFFKIDTCGAELMLLFGVISRAVQSLSAVH